MILCLKGCKGLSVFGSQVLPWLFNKLAKPIPEGIGEVSVPEDGNTLHELCCSCGRMNWRPGARSTFQEIAFPF